MGIDEDTKSRSHLHWSRICVNFFFLDHPRELELSLGDLRYKISILEDVHTSILSGAGGVADEEGKKMNATVTTILEVPTSSFSKEPLNNSRARVGQKHFNSKFPKAKVNLTDQPQSTSFSVPGSVSKKAGKNLGQTLDHTYYSKGPNSKSSKNDKKPMQIWLPKGPVLDPCLNKISPFAQENYFDPLSVEIEAA